MTQRAGSYNRAKPKWRGIIREEGYPQYACHHNHHENPADARECARQALPAIKQREQDPEVPLPEDWFVFIRAYDAQQ